MAMQVEGEAAADEFAIQVRGLSFSPVPGAPELLSEVTFALPKGARCVLVGHNGAGKSTLLELVSGKKMAPRDQILVSGSDPFRGPSGSSVALVQGGWRGSGLTEDRAAVLRVRELLGLGEHFLPEDERGQRLFSALGLAALANRFYGTLSDGERRRVELGRHLREPRAIMLLDEATTDLDLLARKRLMDFLTEESNGAQSTVINASHVFDGLETWATHLLQLHEGRVVRLDAVPIGGPAPWAAAGDMFGLVAGWLRDSAGPKASPPAFAAAGPLPTGDGPCLAVHGMTFAYSARSASPVLQLDGLELPRGARIILVGPNGAGKSSLLSILCGRRLVQDGEVQVLGFRPFHDHTQLDAQVAILSSEWKRQVAEISSGRSLSFSTLANSAIQDLVACGFEMPVLAGRMVRLIQMLGIDPTKPIGTLSDGFMRRVQIALKMLRPSTLVLVDEVTADLDVLARQALLDFLREESDSGCTVVYCTHILDGLDGWSTHVLRLRSGARPCEVLAVADVSADWKLFGAVHQMLVQDAAEDARAAPPAPVIPQDAPVDDGAEAELPFGWKSRQAAAPGGYGNFAWKDEGGSEETWSYSSVAPSPDAPGRSGAGVARPFSGAPSNAPAPPAAPGLFGASPWQAAPAAPPAGAPGPVFGSSEGLFDAPAMIDDRRSTAAPAPSTLPPNDSCPDWFGARSNQLSAEDLVAQGAIAPERVPPF